MYAAIELGDVIRRLRSVVRSFKKKPVMMDELRVVTRQRSYNGRELCPILDCPTRWYSTFDMVERAVRIMPALNDVLKRRESPIDASDIQALREIVRCLAPFKRAILLLGTKRANLSSADKIFQLLIRELKESESALANMLIEGLRVEIAKRRTVLSTALRVLENPQYDFWIESFIGQHRPSDDELINVFVELLDAAAAGSTEPGNSSQGAAPVG